MITRQVLQDYYDLRKRLEEEESMLAALRASAAPGAQNLDGMPHSHEPTDKVGRLVGQIIDMEERIERTRAKIAALEADVTEYIRGIEDSRTALILQLRLVQAMPWKTVADCLGGRNTEEGVKSVYYRFLQRSESCNAVTPRAT